MDQKVPNRRRFRPLPTVFALGALTAALAFTESRVRSVSGRMPDNSAVDPEGAVIPPRQEPSFSAIFRSLTGKNNPAPQGSISGDLDDLPDLNVHTFFEGHSEDIRHLAFPYKHKIYHFRVRVNLEAPEHQDLFEENKKWTSWTVFVGTMANAFRRVESQGIHNEFKYLEEEDRLGQAILANEEWALRVIQGYFNTSALPHVEFISVEDRLGRHDEYHERLEQIKNRAERQAQLDSNPHP